MHNCYVKKIREPGDEAMRSYTQLHRHLCNYIVSGSSIYYNTTIIIIYIAWVGTWMVTPREGWKEVIKIHVQTLITPNFAESANLHVSSLTQRFWSM